jgi:hypothetical protein
MSFKTTYILFGLLIVALGIFLVTQMFGTQTQEQMTYVLPSLHDNLHPVRSDEIDRVEIDRLRPKTEKLVFFKDEQGDWRLKEPSTHADSNTVRNIISDVMGARREEEADTRGGLQVFGLESPSAVVTLAQGTEHEWKLTLGDSSAGGDKAFVYVTSSDAPNEAMAVRRSSLEPLFKSLDDYRSKTLLADSSFEIQSVQMSAPKHEQIALDKKSNGRWHFDKPAFGEADEEGETAPAGATNDDKPITGMRDLLQDLVDLKVDANSDFGATDVGDNLLKERGLEQDQPAGMKIKIKRQPSSSGTSEKKEPIETTLLVGKKVDKEDKYWARLQSERNLVKVPGKKVEAIVKVADNPSILRNRDLVQIDTGRVDAIDVQQAGQTALKLRKAGEPASWKIAESGKLQEADAGAVQKMLNDLTAKRLVKEFPPASQTDAQLGLDKPSVVVSLWEEGIKKEEQKELEKDDRKDAKADAKKEEKKPTNTEPALKDAKPTVKLAFGKKEKDLVYVRREVGNEVTRLAVPASVLTQVSEGKLAYLDRKLPSFGLTSDVTKVVLTRANETYEIDKDAKTPETWKLVQPKDQSGRTADAGKVTHLLDSLHGLQAERFVAEKPSDSDLERFGLKASASKAVVTTTKDKKTEERVYQFGKETDDKTGYYARESGVEPVFVVSKFVVDSLQGDLRESVVYRFDMAKVKGARLTGWQDIIGNPFTLDLERKTSQPWVVKAPPNYNLDSGKIEAFLAGLTNLRAERFLGKITPNPEYKLELRDGALEIVLTLDGEKEPYLLTIGGPSGTDGYYARSNKLPGEVFVVARAPFEQARSKPAYFQK